MNTANEAAFDPFMAIDNAPDQAADDRQLPTNTAAAATARIMYRYRDCDRNEGGRGMKLAYAGGDTSRRQAVPARARQGLRQGRVPAVSP